MNTVGGAEAAGMWQKGRGHGKALWIIAVILVLFGVGKAAAELGIFPGKSDFPSADSSKWQAVFLANNQVYFGHIDDYNKGYAVLKDVYYLQVTQAIQPPPAGQQPQLNLVKLGDELHGPEDMMYIPKDKILFWEHMKADSQVVQAIESTRQ